MAEQPKDRAVEESRCGVCGEVHRRLAGALEQEGGAAAEYRAGLFACHGNRLLSLGIAIPGEAGAPPGQAPAAGVDVFRSGPGVSVRFVDPRESPWRSSGIGKFLTEKDLKAGKLRARFEELARRVVREDPLVRGFLFPEGDAPRAG